MATVRTAVWARVREGWPIWLVAGATFASAVLSLAQVQFSRIDPRAALLGAFLPFGVIAWDRTLTLLASFFLLYLSESLFYRRRVAWWLALAVSVVLTFGHLGAGHSPFGAVSPAVAAALLLAFRKRFQVPTEPRSIIAGLLLMVGCLAVALAYGTVGFWLLDRRDFGITFTWGDAAVRVLRQFALLGNADLTPHTRHARWFLESLSAVGIGAAAAATFSLFRPLVDRLHVPPHERSLAHALLKRWGCSPYDYFKDWMDKSLYFSPSRRAFVSYRTVRGVALSLGDPVGPDEELDALAKAFVRHCEERGWVVCFVMPEHPERYARDGLKLLKFGEEAVVDLERFRAHTGQNRFFRNIRRRFEKAGFTLEEHQLPHPPALLDEVEAVSREWLTLPKHRELSFVQGRFDRTYLSLTPLWVVRDETKRAVAFANQVQSFRDGEATIDLMRHLPQVPNGTMDYLFQGVMLRLRERGFRTFNLGVAPSTGKVGRPGESLTEKVVRLVFRLNWFVSSQGLRNYKLKFEPAWEDRYVAYHGGPFGLIRVALAVTRAVEGAHDGPKRRDEKPRETPPPVSTLPLNLSGSHR